MLAWPAFALLKQEWPDATVCALVPRYTADMAVLCPWIDEVLIDEGESSWLLAQKFRRGKFDGLLTLFSTGRIALAGILAGIPYRLAPATKLFQVLYNHRLVQRRSRSEKPEYAYNIDLTCQLLHDLRGIEAPIAGNGATAEDFLPQSISRPLLAFSTETSISVRDELCAQYNLDPRSKLVFIHPGSGGSANNLTPAQYVELANGLHSSQLLSIIVTAGPGEEEVATLIASGISTHTARMLPPAGGLAGLAHHLQLADLFISCSTGPLHLAGALDRHTAAFYPRHRSGSPLRWQTLNAPEKRLVFTPAPSAGAQDVFSVDIPTAAQVISLQFLR